MSESKNIEQYLEIFVCEKPEDFWKLYDFTFGYSNPNPINKNKFLHAYKNQHLYSIKVKPEFLDNEDTDFDYENFLLNESDNILRFVIICENNILEYQYTDILNVELHKFVIDKLNIDLSIDKSKYIDKYTNIEYSYMSFKDGFGGNTGISVLSFLKLCENIYYILLNKDKINNINIDGKDMIFIDAKYKENPEKNYIQIMIRTKISLEFFKKLFKLSAIDFKKEILDNDQKINIDEFIKDK